MEEVVDLRDVVRGGDVVRVERGVGVEGGFEIHLFGHLLHEEMEAESLGTLRRVVMLVDMGTAFPGDTGGVVRAVVRDHENLDEFLGVILVSDAFNQVRNDLLFIPRGDDEGISFVFWGFRITAATAENA